jgi:hypothetical protein
MSHPISKIQVECSQVDPMVQSGFNEFFCRIAGDCFTDSKPYTKVVNQESKEGQISRTSTNSKGRYTKPRRSQTAIYHVMGFKCISGLGRHCAKRREAEGEGAGEKMKRKDLHL